MSTNTDIIKDDDIKRILTNEKQTSKIDDPPKELYRETLSQRFYADLIKDMSVPYEGINGPTKLTDIEIKKILNSSFGYEVPSNVFNWSKTQLHERFEAVVGEKSVNRANITKYKNILKTSTIAVGGFSSAPFQLYESGFGIDFICAISKCFTVDTAAAHLDTAGKPKGKDIITSKIDIDITQKFFKELGFPGTLSVTTEWDGDECNLTIDYNSNKIEGKIYPTRDDVFNNYTLGNKEKNDVLANNPTNGDENAKILLVKELGDVLQVLEYYAIINYFEKDKNYKAEDIRKKFNIQTTDSVVFDLCVNMGLPVTYTGSREGVTSGGVSIYMYEYGKLDMAEVYKNRFGKIYDGLIAQLNSVQFGITTGIAMLKQISYKVPQGWRKPTRTRKTIEIDTADGFYENKQTTGQDKSFKQTSEESTQNKIELLQSILKEITDTKNKVTTEKERLKVSITSESDFDALVNELTRWSTFNLDHDGEQISSTKDLPLLTKVKGVGYVIQNDNLSKLFAKYSGYVSDNASGGDGKRKRDNSNSSSSSKMDEMDVEEENKTTNEPQDLGLEECIYLKKAYDNLKPNENNMDENDFGVALSIEYANVIRDALNKQNNDITYPKLLLKYGGYEMGDNGTEVFIDEETANKIVNEMNKNASRYLHIAKDNHKEEILILLDEYYTRLFSLAEHYNWRPVSEGTRKRKMDSNSSNTDTSTQDDTRLCIPDDGCNDAPRIINIDGTCISINDIMKTTANVVSKKIQDIHDDKNFKPNDFVPDEFEYFYYTKGTETKKIEDAAIITKINNCFMSFTEDYKYSSSIITPNSSDRSKKQKMTNSSSQGGKARKLTKKKQKKNQKQRTRRKRKTRRKNMRKTIKKKRINKKRKTIKKRNGKNNK
tara:strand:+ start:44 stop:2698 length:2655 start_codon:yes stop_codon:yes gene_type:complete